MIKTFSSGLQNLSYMLQWVRGYLADQGIDPKAIRRIELASEEALVNVMQHAYGEKKGNVEIRLEIGPERITLSIRDWGPPFNPLQNVPVVDVNATLDERETGGLGIYLMHQVIDEVVYSREQNTNLLTLVKYIRPLA